MSIKIPKPELVAIEKLKTDGQNPNKMTQREKDALLKNFKHYGFLVPIICDENYLVADGEQRLQVAKILKMDKVEVIKLPISDSERRILRQVMNKLKGEHDIFLDAEEYARIIAENQRDLLKALLSENDQKINNLLKLRDRTPYSDEDLKRLAANFVSRVESNVSEEATVPGDPLTLKFHAEFCTKSEITKRTLAVSEAFGLGIDEEKRFLVFDNYTLDFHKGDLIYITGDSGGGKTLLLNAFKSFFKEETLDASQISINPEETLIEGVGKDTKEAIEILTMCGLNDAFLFLRRFKELSDGQKYRYRLAKMINEKEKTIWVLDEFCATLDRVMARIVAYLLQKLARKLKKTVVVATTHQDLIEDFQPEILIEKGYESEVSTKVYTAKRKLCSLFNEIHMEQGDFQDYLKLEQFHYRTKGKEKKRGGVIMRSCYKVLHKDNLIGIIVYSYSYLTLKPRNMVFGERYKYSSGDLQVSTRINTEIARIARVVIHPKYRGIGLGEYLVRESLKKVDFKVVEALAVMGKYNPFFEKAGMKKVDYEQDTKPISAKIKTFLAEQGFNVDLANSSSYCETFYNSLSDDIKKRVLAMLKKFAKIPYIKHANVDAKLITKLFNTKGTYLYWVQPKLLPKEENIQQGDTP